MGKNSTNLSTTFYYCLARIRWQPSRRNAKDLKRTYIDNSRSTALAQDPNRVGSEVLFLITIKLYYHHTQVLAEREIHTLRISLPVFSPVNRRFTTST